MMSPLGDDEYNADLACDLGYPLIVVAPNTLGVINQTLQTLIVASTFRDGLDVAGVVLNHISTDTGDVSVSSNAAEIAARAVPPLLTEVGWQADRFSTDVDWFGLASRRQHR